MAGDHLFALISMTGLYGVRALVRLPAEPDEKSRIPRRAPVLHSVNADSNQADPVT